MNQQNLINKLNEAANHISKTARIGLANYIYSKKLDIRFRRIEKLERINLKNKIEEMNVITLCGSTKYKEEFLLVNKWLTLQGNIVISVSMFGHVDKEPLTQQEKITLDEVHKRKIDLANEIFVIDINGYIGESTRSEIEYAESKGKKIKYYSKEKDDLELWKNKFYNREIIEDWNNSDFKIYQDPNKKAS